MRWTFEVDFLIPSANELNIMHWATRYRMKEKLGWTLRSALNKIPPIPKATAKRKLTLIRLGKRSLDKDNLYAGAKMLMDCIKGLKLLVDDDPDWVDLHVDQEKCGRTKPRTRVIIEDLDNPLEAT